MLEVKQEHDDDDAPAADEPVLEAEHEAVTVAGSQPEETPGKGAKDSKEADEALLAKLRQFKEGMIKRNKEKLDGKSAKVIKILSKSVKVLFLEGPVESLAFWQSVRF